MLTDEDFDQLGKRLYDLEADPPDKGWDRIAADTVPPPRGAKKRTVLGRHWWKGLLIILPLSVYLFWPDSETYQMELELAGIALETENGSRANHLITENNGPDSTGLGINQKNNSGISNSYQGTTRIAEASGGISTSSGVDTRRANGGNEIPGLPINQDAIQDVVSEDYPNHHKNSNEADLSENENIINISPDASLQLQDPDHETTRSIADYGAHESLSKQDSRSEGDIMNTSPVAATTDDNHSNGVDNSSRLSRSVDPAPNRNARGLDEVIGEPGLEDSTVATEIVILDGPSNPQDKASSKQSDDADQEQRPSSWRLTASIAPQFSYKSVTPVGNDEVLVTNIKTRSGYPERAGFAFAAGAGKEILRNVYIDAQITYARTSQRIGFSYATGRIDTLLAVQGGDGSVRVIPVYQVTDREQKSTLGYGGIRITATHYFWLKGKRRFNISAGAGINRIVSNTFEEKINGAWITFDDLALSKTNYHFTLGAGYNIAFGNGWELMFSPMLTHYIKKFESIQQPFHLAHRSYGLNIMMSKSLR